MDERYRLVVLGGGTAGLSAAVTARRLGTTVAVVEGRRPGGTSVWAGGLPTSALFQAAGIATTIRTAARFGIIAERPVVDFAAVMRHVRGSIEAVLMRNTAELAEKGGVRLIHGEAEFIDPRTIRAGDHRIRARQVIIATGSYPVIPTIPGLDDIPYLTPESVFDLSDLPDRIIVLGGGPSGCELGQAFSRLGSRVTIVERSDRLLPAADEEASDELKRRLEEEGIAIRLGRSLSRVERDPEGIVAELGGELLFADALLVATGRRPNFEGLGLPRAGVVFDEDGIRVDDRLRTSTPHIFAAGDVIGSSQLSHYAAFLGATAARNAILPLPVAALRSSVPWCVMTDPGVAQIGLTESQARARFGEIRLVRQPVSEIDQARTEGEIDGVLKLVAKPDGTLLGASIVSHRAVELTNVLALALEHDLKLADLATALQIYPSYGSAAQQLASEAYYRGLRQGVLGPLVRLFVH